MKKKTIKNSMIALFIFMAGITLTYAQTWDFTNDLEGWQNAEATNCSASWSDDGSMKITVLNEQTQLFHPDFRGGIGFWYLSGLNHLVVRVKNESASDKVRIPFWIVSADDLGTGFTRPVECYVTPNSNEYEVFTFDLAQRWEGFAHNWQIYRARIDVNNTFEGDVYIDYIHFKDALPEADSITVKGSDTISGIGEEVRYRVNAFPEGASTEVDWSVDNYDIASIDEKGLLTTLADGTVTVTATAKDGSGLEGQLVVSVVNTATAITSEKVPNFGLYPNPLNGGDLLKVKLSNVNMASEVKVSIADLSGKNLFASTFEGGEEIVVPTAGLVPGMYMIAIQSDILMENSKFVIRQ
jgi:hypothetical protein